MDDKKEDWVVRFSVWLEKHLLVYYILEWTWAFTENFVGAIITLALICCGKKPRMFHHFVYVPVGKNWGGIEFGMFFLTDDTPGNYILFHEAGHSYQMALMGPFNWFVSFFPSCIRYQYREWRSRHGKTNPPYDSMYYFEGQASAIGEKLFGSTSRKE